MVSSLTPTSKHSLAHVLFSDNPGFSGVGMADVPAEDIAHLEELTNIHRRRLRFLETQSAALGPLAIPAHIALELEDTRRDLARSLADLRRLRPGPSAERSPYLGLLTFQETNADLFF